MQCLATSQCVSVYHIFTTSLPVQLQHRVTQLKLDWHAVMHLNLFFWHSLHQFTQVARWFLFFQNYFCNSIICPHDEIIKVTENLYWCTIESPLLEVHLGILNRPEFALKSFCGSQNFQKKHGVMANLSFKAHSSWQRLLALSQQKKKSDLKSNIKVDWSPFSNRGNVRFKKMRGERACFTHF